MKRKIPLILVFLILLIHVALGQSASTRTIWTSSTSSDTVVSLDTTPLNSVSATLVASGTFSGGVISFEVSDNAGGWYAITGQRVNSTTSETTFTLTATTQAWQFNVTGFSGFRIRLSTVITGTSTPAVLLKLEGRTAIVIKKGSVGTLTSLGLALGTSGSDANVSGSPITGSGTITVNLPSASAINRGLLLAADWSTFNAKYGNGSSPSFATIAASSPISLANGTAGAPSLTFTNSPTTGFFRNAADEIGVSVAGTSAWKITSAGIIPTTTAAYSIGTSSLLPQDIYVNRNFFVAPQGSASNGIHFSPTASRTTIYSNGDYLGFRAAGSLYMLLDSDVVTIYKTLIAGSTTNPIQVGGTSGQSGILMSGPGVENLGLFWDATPRTFTLMNANGTATSTWIADTGIRLVSGGINTTGAGVDIKLGGTSASFPALKRNATAVNFRLADDSADAPITASTIGANTSLAVGGGTAILKHLSATATLDFANLAAIGCEDLTITVTGAALGDSVAIGIPNGSVVANGTFTGWVSATNTVTVRFCTVVSGDPASGTFRADVWQH